MESDPPRPSDPPPDDADASERERLRQRLERVLPEIIKRVVETGYEKFSEGPENVRHFVSELKLPKEALQLIISQIDETKNGLYRVVAREIRDFLDHTNFSEEMARALTMLSFEIKTEVRFIPNDQRAAGATGARPSVKSKVRVHRSEPPPRQSRPPPPSSRPPPAADPDQDVAHEQDPDPEPTDDDPTA